ncbi:glycosyltransferase family 4 protein [Listeria fleischmannii]|nr:glycosyltransferase family 4 protein [Listeria fleischmannii]
MLNSKKVMMFSSVHVWNDTRIYYKEAISLADAGFKVHFYAIENGMELVSHPNITVILLNESKSRLSRPLRWHYLYQAAKKTDAKFYHFHDPELLLLMPRLKKHKPHATFIYDMHENFTKDLLTKKWIPTKFSRKVVSWFARWMETITMKYLDYIIFAEKSYAESYKHISCQKIEVLNYPTYQKRVFKHKIFSTVFNIVYVGSITEDRGVFEMLEVISILKKRHDSQFKLQLVGPVAADLDKKIQAFIYEHRLHEIVELHGRIPYPEIWEIYAHADIGICILHPLPNYVKSLPTKLFEYMAAALPIVASHFTSWEQLIEKHQAGFTVDPFDLETMAAEISTYSKEKELLTKMGNNGRKAYEEAYHWEIEAQKMIQAIYTTSEK